MSKENILQRDIAKMIGLHQSTVSHVLRGTPNKVSVKTQERVRQLCKKFNYQPNAHAQSLRLSKSNLIGVVVAPMRSLFHAHLIDQLSEELAREKGIVNGGQVIVESARGQVAGVAMVTKRFKPFRINGGVVHEVGLPWHWGYTGLSTGDSANLLTPHVGDANTMIPEFKAFLCNVSRA